MHSIIANEKKTPVPKLDLAPKLKRPLSLWNPLDYLLLLYWVFFFPQALPWYVDNFGSNYLAQSKINWYRFLGRIYQDSVQNQLFFQGFLLIVSTSLLIRLTIEQLDIYFGWFSITVGIAFIVAVGVAFSVAFNVAVGFETIEELIETGKIPPNLMGYLRGLVQMSPQIAFAFAGLHTLEEMTANYFQPFFASVIPIRVGFLNAAATRQILANPSDDFLLDYTQEALERIYELTSGQPYLVQLVGFQLVRRYNDYVFEQGQTRAPIFTLEDVEIVISDLALPGTKGDRTFFQNGRYYFEGVWKQAVEGAPGQQDIIRLIAPYWEGLSRQELLNAISEDVNLDKALETLKRHDVVVETDTVIKIIVELFRRWADEKIE